MDDEAHGGVSFPGITYVDSLNDLESFRDETSPLPYLVPLESGEEKVFGVLLMVDSIQSGILQCRRVGFYKQIRGDTSWMKEFSKTRFQIW